MDTFEPDKCCSKHIRQALEKLAAASSWDCPDCGCTWKPQEVLAKLDSGETITVRHWQAKPFFAVF